VKAEGKGKERDSKETKATLFCAKANGGVKMSKELTLDREVFGRKLKEGPGDTRFARGRIQG